MNDNSASRCSTVAAALGEPLAGTAATAATWLCVEQSGPWGRDAITQSHLDPGLGAELTTRSAGTGVRIVLIRRPGKHADRHVTTPRRVYLAHTAPGATWLSRTDLRDPKELLDLDFAAAGRGEDVGFGAPDDASLLMVCANSRRDVCCALLGRPVAEALVGAHGDAVWECTHIGGHRFSPTALLLPTGYAYGALDVAFASRLLTDGRQVAVERCRGRSTWPGAAQVADLAVREIVGTTDPDAVIPGQPEAIEAGWTVPVSHVDGRRWQVGVRRAVFGGDRPASCGAAPTPADGLVLDGVEQL